ncbi:MAG: MYG1 family protein [Candidatus Woesearchaeota archaeon]
MIPTIAVHDGPFHADDVFACATLLECFDARIIRTRDSTQLAQANYRVDVGMRYDVSTHDFDHHQQQGAGMRPNGIPYASFGLVWKHFGTRLCEQVVVDYLDTSFVQHIDGPDNGVQILSAKEGFYVYSLHSLFLHMRPTWKEHDYDERFLEAVEFARVVLRNEIRHAQATLEAQQRVAQALEQRPHKSYVLFDQYLPWKELVMADADILYVGYKKEDGSWALQCVNSEPNSFAVRKSLPEAWWGQDENVLQTYAHGLLFCHRNGFLCVFATKDDLVDTIQKLV